MKLIFMFLLSILICSKKLPIIFEKMNNYKDNKRKVRKLMKSSEYKNIKREIKSLKSQLIGLYQTVHNLSNQRKETLKTIKGNLDEVNKERQLFESQIEQNNQKIIKFIKVELNFGNSEAFLELKNNFRSFAFDENNTTRLLASYENYKALKRTSQKSYVGSIEMLLAAIVGINVENEDVTVDPVELVESRLLIFNRSVNFAFEVNNSLGVFWLKSYFDEFYQCVLLVEVINEKLTRGFENMLNLDALLSNLIEAEQVLVKTKCKATSEKIKAMIDSYFKGRLIESERNERSIVYFQIILSSMVDLAESYDLAAVKGLLLLECLISVVQRLKKFELLLLEMKKKNETIIDIRQKVKELKKTGKYVQVHNTV